jgi:hypothetical protein
MLMIDEAYQLKYSSFAVLRGLAPRSLTIGDPGQIDPIVQGSVRHWADDAEGPHLPAPRVVLARNEARRFQLPISRRLPSDSADIVRDAFYPGLSFSGLVTPAMRHLGLRLAGITPVDGILDAALGCGSVAAVTLPRRVAPPADLELIDLLVEIVRRILSRDPVVVEGPMATGLKPADIGVVVSYREQVTAVAQALGPYFALQALETVGSLDQDMIGDCRNLEDLTALSGLANVENVKLLACPKISDLTPLASIKGLKELAIVGCDNITTLAPLAGHTSLKKVAIGEPDLRRLQIPESLLPIIDPDHMLYRVGIERDMNYKYRAMRYVYSPHRPWYFIRHVDPFDDELIEVVHE